MRTSPAALALLLACTANPSAPAPEVKKSEVSPPPATSRTVTVPGLSVEVPATWVALAPDQLAATRAAMAGELPAEATLTIDAAHAAEGQMEGMVFLHRLDASRDSSARTRTVRQALMRMREDMETRVIADGGEILASEYSERASGLEGCGTARMHHPAATVEVRMCTRMWHSSPERLTMSQVMCMGKQVESVCGPILAGRKFAVEPAIGLGEVLPPNVAPPVALGGVGGDRVAGVVFGMSRAEFLAACAASGFAAESVEVGGAEEGRCAGLPGDHAAFTVGPVTRVVATFVGGRLAVASIEVSSPPAEVEAKVMAAYPEFVFTPAMRIYRVDDEAQGDQLRRAALAGPRDDGGSTLHFYSALAGPR